MDITKCQAKDCPVKDKCYRFTSPASGRQSYFLDKPYEIKDGKFTCEAYWGDGEREILSQLEYIVNGKK